MFGKEKLYTTNSLEGSFSHFKELLRVHRGLKKKRKLKLRSINTAKIYINPSISCFNFSSTATPKGT